MAWFIWEGEQTRRKKPGECKQGMVSSRWRACLQLSRLKMPTQGVLDRLTLSPPNAQRESNTLLMMPVASASCCSVMISGGASRMMLLQVEVGRRRGGEGTDAG